MYYPVSDCPGLYSNFGNPLLDLSGNLEFWKFECWKIGYAYITIVTSLFTIHFSTVRKYFLDCSLKNKKKGP